MPELSIIVPVYKVEKYLPRCIDSILAQTFRDFELILIDDGSPDNCGAICDGYAARDSRIKVIHQQNAGVSAARNAGLDIACGTYLGFVDSDDWIEPEMYETMIATAKEKHVDVVVCGLKYINANNTEIIDNGSITELRLVTGDEALARAFGLKQKLFHGSLCNKLFRSRSIKGCRLSKDIHLFEDWLMVLSILDRTQNIAMLPNSYYWYTANSDFSSAKSLNAEKVLGSLTVFYRLLPKYADKKSLYSVVLERYLDDSMRYLLRIKKDSGRFRVVILLKWRMLCLLGKAKLKHLLPSTVINRYLYEGVFRA